MLSIWANLSLILGAIVVAGLLWFVLIIVGKSVFDDFLVNFFRKFKRRVKKEKDKDHYVY